MLCPKCNNPLDINGNCSHCGYQNKENPENLYNAENVQTMNNSDTHNYDGVTIEEENNFRKESFNNTQNSQYNNGSYYRQSHTRFYKTYSNRRNSGPKIHFFNLTPSKTSWLTKGLIALGGAAVLAFFFFIALPVLLTLVGVGIVAWIIFNFFKRR